VHPFEHDEGKFEEFLVAQGRTREQFDADTKEAAERSVRTRLVLDALADAEQVEVNDQELTERIVFQAQQYQMPPEEFVRRIQEAGQLGAIYSDVRRSKALIAAVRSATVTDGSGAPVDMSDLLGEDDEPEPQVLEVPAPEDDASAEGAVAAASAAGESTEAAEEQPNEKARADS
jgi:trigger factor